MFNIQTVPDWVTILSSIGRLRHTLQFSVVQNLQIEQISPKSLQFIYYQNSAVFYMTIIYADVLVLDRHHHL